MPEDTNRIQPGEEPAPDRDETAGTEPSKIKLPDGKEYTPDELAEAVNIKNNIYDWRKSLDDRGSELNRMKRELSDGLDEVRKLKEQPQPPQPIQVPMRDWRQIDDPEERQKVFFENTERLVRENIDATKRQVSEVYEKLTASEQARKKQAEYEYWRDRVDNALNDVAGDDEKSRQLAEGLIQVHMNKIPYQQWDDDLLNDAKRMARETLETYSNAKIENYLAGKKQDAGKKVSNPSGSPAPEAGGKFKVNMSQAERLRLIDKDPNA